MNSRVVRISWWAALAGMFAMIVAAGSLHGCGDDGRDDKPCCAVCGDGVCSGDESTCNCPLDPCSQQNCTGSFPTCGDGFCEEGGSPGENHENCAADCPSECRACGGNASVYVDGTLFPDGGKCPEGTTSAYRADDLIVCSTCRSNADCSSPFAPACLTQCVPNCEIDGECCPVARCSLD